LYHYANQFGFDYDYNGEIASKGSINQELVSELNDLEFYSKNFPKSLGFEWVETAFLTIVEKHDLSIEVKMISCLEHMLIQLNNCFEIYDINNVLITGGGTKNDLLINRLKEKTTTEIIIPTENLIDFKEALIFAFLGYKKFNNQINCLASVTGATKDHSSGVIYDVV